MHEWMSDNGLTPQLVVDASAEGMAVPAESITDGKIVLNVSYEATRGLNIGKDLVSFEARFKGVAHWVEVPATAVLGIYARETGQGMIFTDEEPPSGPDGSGEKGESSWPKLKLVK